MNAYIKKATAHILFCVLLPSTLPAIASAEEATPPALPLQEIQEFVSVFERVRTEYVEALSQKQLLQLALEGLMLKLDPYSEYLDALSTKELRSVAEGSYVGIGIEVLPTGHYITVISPIDNGPAQKAGILAGDLIKKINGVNLKGLARTETYNLLNGPKGSKLQLTILRKGQELDFELTRDEINAVNITSKLLDDKIGYIRISVFQKRTAFELEKTLLALRQQGAVGWIIDLRNNPGGVMQEGVASADAFLREGEIVSTKDRSSSVSKRVFANKLDASGNLPTLVLINRGSASAAEILAAALQDNNRAVIVGETSFGKGSVQSVISLDDTRSIRLTTAYYFTPNGNNLNGIGIVPNIAIDSALDNEQTLDKAIAIMQDRLQ